MGRKGAGRPSQAHGGPRHRGKLRACPYHTLCDLGQVLPLSAHLVPHREHGVPLSPDPGLRAPRTGFVNPARPRQTASLLVLAPPSPGRPSSVCPGSSGFTSLPRGPRERAPFCLCFARLPEALCAAEISGRVGCGGASRVTPTGTRGAGSADPAAPEARGPGRHPDPLMLICSQSRTPLEVTGP